MLIDFSEYEVRDTISPRISLRAARISCGYTMKEVAKEINISAGTLSKYERNSNETPIDVAYKLLQLYKFPFQFIRFRI